jgi:hypothetical protein
MAGNSHFNHKKNEIMELQILPVIYFIQNHGSMRPHRMLPKIIKYPLRYIDTLIDRFCFLIPVTIQISLIVVVVVKGRHYVSLELWLLMGPLCSPQMIHE